MFKKLIYLISLAIFLNGVGVQGASFSLLPTHDAEVGNDTQIGPDQNAGGGSGMAIRDIDVRRRVSFVSYDVSQLKASGQLVGDVSFSNYGHDSGTILVYGVIEELDNIDEATITWNTAPGVQNNPTPPLGSPVALDYADLTDQLMSFVAPARGIRTSTETSQALADFINNDTDGVITFLFAPPAGQNNGILRTKEMGADGGTLLQGSLVGLPQKAQNPNPANNATDVSRDVVLSWTPAGNAAKHDVYLGTSFGDVNDATPALDLTGVYRGRQDPNFYPAGGTIRLDIAQTYYWRVDEISAPPENAIYRGNIWQFTVEPLAYAIAGGTITATASSSEPGKGPENTINGSGLDESGLLHGNLDTGAMWLSNRAGIQPTWINYDLGKVYRLHEMWVWNFNGSLEPVIGLGFKEVVIEYSVNGADYVTLGDTHTFNRAPGEPDYAHDTTIDLTGVEARYVRLTANSNWESILTQYGLSEVRFFYIPIQAREPRPASGATGVPLNVTLGWRAGREAAQHNVYLSDDRQAVMDGTASVVTVTGAGYGPLSLDVGKTYYWRVDEVNDPSIGATMSGDLWSFTTTEFLVIDDFELYDANDNQIWYAWHDGLGYGSPTTPPYFAGNGTGAAVGDENTASFTEQTIVHSGSQSMPLNYDNNKQGFAKYSEAELTLTSLRDWTAGGVGALALWFRGNPASVGSFVEAPAGTYTMTATGVDIWGQADQFHYAFKTLNGVGTIEAQVLSVDNTDPWAKAGVMIRETLDAGSKHAFVCVTPANGVAFQSRDFTDGVSSNTNQTGLAAPYWVKLERDAAGNFTASHSANGTTWQPVGNASPMNIPMNTAAYIGLALTSHDVALTCQAVFTNVTTTGTVSPQWAHQDIGIASNAAEPLYVAVSNATGQPAVVVHPDAKAAQIATWTEWVIPLSDLSAQGITLTNVDKIALGLGTKGNMTTPGGSGKMYFDDIRLYRPRTAP